MNDDLQNTCFITGLPRSRTAWFSNYLTYGNSFCFHDAFHLLDKPEDFPARLESARCSTGNIVGNSDPANVMYWERIVEWFPDAKWVVIKRPIREVFESCKQIMPMHPEFLIELDNKLDRLIAALKPVIIDFHAITPEMAMKVAEYCGVDAGPMWRAEQLCRMNVQIDPEYLRRAIGAIIAKSNETILA